MTTALCAEFEMYIAYSGLLLYEIDYGDAAIRFFIGPPNSHATAERVVKDLPFFTRTGKVVIESWEDYYVRRFLVLKPGQYRLSVFQTGNDERLNVDLFFDPSPEPDRPKTTTDN